jgi:hypothetical protein
MAPKGLDTLDVGGALGPGPAADANIPHEAGR